MQVSAHFLSKYVSGGVFSLCTQNWEVKIQKSLKAEQQIIIIIIILQSPKGMPEKLMGGVRLALPPCKWSTRGQLALGLLQSPAWERYKAPFNVVCAPSTCVKHETVFEVQETTQCTAHKCLASMSKPGHVAISSCFWPAAVLCDVKWTTNHWLRMHNVRSSLANPKVYQSVSSLAPYSLPNIG